MSIDVQKSKSVIGSIGEFTTVVFEATAKLFGESMKYERLSRQEAACAVFGLVGLLAFPVFVGYLFVSTLSATSIGPPSFLAISATLFVGGLLVVGACFVQWMLIVSVTWIAGFVKHFSS